MRFHSDGPSIPDILLERCDAGRVVFLCGAGVSLPSGMPTFIGLAQYVIEYYDPPADSDIMIAFQPWLKGQSAANVPLDQIFNLLHLEYGKDEVNSLVTARLSAPLGVKNVGREHGLIKRISSGRNRVPQIVTTNFDRLFEAGPGGERLVGHIPPAFPDLNFGSAIEGITYLHGRLVELDSVNHPYVLSSADFGRAYLSEGWATNFIRHLLERYTVVLVGYKAEDPPIKYLLQGLNHDGKYDRSKLFAFDRGLPEEIEAKWRDRGVTAIAYADHSDLWKSMESWAERADDPRKWRSSVVAKCRQNPNDLAHHERGQVAHVLRTAQGAKLFAEADPLPHAEWLCVLDGNIRSAKPNRGFGENAEVFDPWAVYGLDDDLRELSDNDRSQGASIDNLLVWREGDDTPHDFHRLGAPVATIPKRLAHYSTWIGASVDSPVIAWWAIRQNGLHPQLLRHLEWQVEHSKTLDERGVHIWNLILEHHRDSRNFQLNGDWFDLKKRVNAYGWTASVLREFHSVATPRLEIKPPYGLEQVKPPSASWQEVKFSDLGEFEVVFLERHNEQLDVPDNMLPHVLGVLEQQLIICSGLLRDIETIYFETPTCYPGPEVDGRDRVAKTAEIVTWFIRLFDRLADKSPEIAHAHATTWATTDEFFFRKLKLYAFSKSMVFEPDHVANELLGLADEAFWDHAVARELLFLLVARWSQFSLTRRSQLTARILSGPDKGLHSDDEYPQLRVEFAARYARYLELQGCELGRDASVGLAEMIKGIHEWRDSWAAATVNEPGGYTVMVGTDEKPDALMNLPVSEVVSSVRDGKKRSFDSFTEMRPFTGLVKIDPRKALCALTIAGKNDDYPTALWSSLIDDIPSNVSPRLRRAFLNRLARLPHEVIAELRHTLGRWLEKNLVSVLDFDGDLGWAVYDQIIDGLLAAGADAAKSGLEEVRQGGKVIQRSRRTFSHAINGPIGMCVETLLSVLLNGKHGEGALIPDQIKHRFERLLRAPGEGSDHAVAIATHKLNGLMLVDPAWTGIRLIPMLEFEHPSSESAWNGFLHMRQVPRPPLAAIIKPLLLRIVPWVENLAWDRDLSAIAAQWLGFMRLFRPNEECGLSRVEMRTILRTMSDETRNQFIFWLGRVGQTNENGWIKYIVPLLDEDWPRERRYRTSASIGAWIAMLDDTGDSFPAVYNAVQKFLVPVEMNDHPFYRFTREITPEKSLTSRFPDVTLDLMNKVTPEILTRQPYELPKVLALIAESEPSLMSDPRYLRLIDLVERS